MIENVPNGELSRLMGAALCSDTAESTKSRFKNARIQSVGWSGTVEPLIVITTALSQPSSQRTSMGRAIPGRGSDPASASTAWRCAWERGCHG